MSEIHPIAASSAEFVQYNLSHRQLLVVATVGDEALAGMRYSYGSGRSVEEPGVEASYPLHGSMHGEQVGIDSRRGAAALDLPEGLQAAADSAGKAHDEILTDGNGTKLARGEMEQATAERFRRRAVEHGAPAWLGDIGAYAILGTQPSFDAQGGPRGQAVNYMEFPDKATEQVAHSVACADIGAPFTAAGPLCAFRWYLEDHGFQVGQQPTFTDARRADIINYWTGQRNFVGGFKFSHPIGGQLFGVAGMRGQVVAYHEQMLADLQAGRITSWQEIEFSAKEFYARHAASAVGTGSAVLL